MTDNDYERLGYKKLTVGQLKEELKKYSDDTVIQVGEIVNSSYLTEWVSFHLEDGKLQIAG